MAGKFPRELMLPPAFLLGIALSHFSPLKLQLLVDLAKLFVSFFFNFAPIFIFLILACSLSAELGSTRAAEYAVPIFLLTSLSLSALTSAILSALSSGKYELIIEEESLDFLTSLASNVMSPIPLSIILGIAVPALISPKFIEVRKALISLHRALTLFFKLILKILPLISLSFGSSFYYSLGLSSLSAYAEALASMAALSSLYALAAMLLLIVLLKVDPRVLASYTARTFLMGISLPSSYVLLLPHLELFSSHFNADGSSDAVLAMGSALNRVGSVIGVIISVAVTSKYLNAPIGIAEFLMLSVIVAIIGFASPGIPGGTILVAMPAIISSIRVPDPEAFSLTAVAVFNGITILTASTNAVFTGYTALIVRKIMRLSVEGKG